MNPIEGGPAQENVALGCFKQNNKMINVAVIKQMCGSRSCSSRREKARAAEGFIRQN